MLLKSACFYRTINHLATFKTNPQWTFLYSDDTKVRNIWLFYWWNFGSSFPQQFNWSERFLAVQICWKPEDESSHRVQVRKLWIPLNRFLFLFFFNLETTVVQHRNQFASLIVMFYVCYTCRLSALLCAALVVGIRAKPHKPWVRMQSFRFSVRLYNRSPKVMTTCCLFIYIYLSD